MWFWIGLPVNLSVPLEGGELLSKTQIKGECAADVGRQALRSGVPIAHCLGLLSHHHHQA